jgi:hypothetical protein
MEGPRVTRARTAGLVAAVGAVSLALGACSIEGSSHPSTTVSHGPTGASPTTSPDKSGSSTTVMTQASTAGTGSQKSALGATEINEINDALAQLQSLLNDTNADFVAGQKENSAQASSLACKAPTLRSARALLSRELSTRATQLHVLSTRVTDTKDTPAPEVPQLNRIVTRELTVSAGGGIQGLEKAVAKAPNCGALIADARTMVKEFWVYALASPQIDLTAVASVEAVVDSQISAIEPTTNAAITTAVQKGSDVSAAQAEFSDLETELTASVVAVRRVSIPTLLSQQPANFPGDLSALVGDHDSVAAAGADLGDVSSDLRSILGILS